MAAQLKEAATGISVIACSTCRLSADAREGSDGRTGGQLLAGALREVRDADPAFAEIAVDEMPCLFACGDHCTVHLRAPGKIGYVLGRFAPTPEVASAILAYAAEYARSEVGQVPYRLWPTGVKGHFLTRMPPPGYIVE